MPVFRNSTRPRLPELTQATGASGKIGRLGVRTEQIRCARGILPKLHPDDRDLFAANLRWVAEAKARKVTIHLRLNEGDRWCVRIVTLKNRTEIDGIAVPGYFLHPRTSMPDNIAQFRSIVEKSTHGIVVHDSSILYANRALLKLLKLNSQKDLFDLSGIDDIVHPEDRARVNELGQKRLLGQSTPSENEFRVVRSDGSAIWVNCFASRITWDGKPAILASLYNIDRRKQYEAQIIEEKARAEAANTSKKEFLANMSHELRTPLNAIIGFSEMMRSEILGPIGQTKYRDYAGHIHSSGEHLLGLINDILDLSKIEAGKYELRETRVSLPELFDSCVSALKPRADESGVTIEVKSAENMREVFADERVLKQILFNLLSNAIKFTPRGRGISLGSHVRKSGRFAISVTDAGIGMNEAQIQIALSPFGQVDSGLARKHRGTGLGLPLVKSFTEKHGGTLEIRSVPGSGTRISVVLPAERLLLPTLPSQS